jgi:hypothetical protein
VSDQAHAAIHYSWSADYAIGQWLSGSTAKAYRPTLHDLENAGYTVLRRDELSDTGHVIVGRGELAALIDVCRAGYGIAGKAAESLRHIEGRLAARLRQQP